MLRAILSNRLSSNNEAKENRTVHKTPSKKALNKTIGNNKPLKNNSSKKINKLQVLGSDLNALNIINDEKELLKQNSLKTPLKVNQQRAPLSNIKKANVKEKSLKNLNNQFKKNPHSIKKNSNSLSIVPSSSIKLNNKYKNENENISLHNKSHKIQNSLYSPSLKKNNIFEPSHTSSKETNIKENIFITHMKNNTINETIQDEEIEYMPPSLSHLEEEIEPKYKIDYEELMKIKPVTVVDSDIFKRVNEEIDIELNSKSNTFKTKDFEFVNDFILDDNSSKPLKIKVKNEKTKNESINHDKKNNNEINDDDDITNNDETNKNKKDITNSNDNKKEKEKALQRKLSQDFNLSFEESSEDEEIKLPDFLSDDKDSLYFDEIHL